MTEPVPGLARRLAVELSEVRWLPPEELRRRARVRRRGGLAAASAALAVVLIAVVGVPALRGGGGPQRAGGPPLGSELPPDERAVPADALLQPEDVGAGYRVQQTGVWPATDEGWALAWADCPQWASLGVTGYQLHIALRRVYLAGPGYAEIVQDVRRYLPGKAERLVPEAERVATRCSTFTGLLPPNYARLGLHTLAVVREGFAGRQSVLVRHTMRTLDSNGMPTGAATVRLYAVVRVGDLVASIDLPGSLEERADELAGAAARRLCAAPSAC